MRLFWEKGYGSTSVADLLAAAKVNSGSLYHFFPGKQDVLVAVLEAYHAGIDEMLLAPAWVGCDDPIEKVFALLAQYRRSIVATDCTYGCPIGSLALEIHEPDPPVREPRVDTADGPVFGALRAWRTQRARTDGMPPYVIAHDATLRAIADANPRSLAALNRVKGMGPQRVDRYGDEILAVLAAAGEAAAGDA